MPIAIVFDKKLFFNKNVATDSAEPFTTLTPEELLLKKSEHRIDTMFGYTSGEMFLVLARDIQNPDLLKQFDEQFEVELPWKSKLKYDFNSKVMICVCFGINWFTV